VFAIQGDCQATSVEQRLLLPKEFELLQNYPNPFNPNTTILFYLKSTAEVKLDIYNTAGQLVKSLVYGQKMAGQHAVSWSGLNNQGKLVPSGVYFSRLTVGEFVDQRKMLLVK